MIALPKGFRAAGVAAGLKKNNDLDLALIVSDTDCAAAATFTTNRVKAAPVLYDQRLMAEGRTIRAVVINAGNANACTGAQGMRDCEETAALVAAEVGCPAHAVFVMSTGVIGVPLPMDKLRDAVPRAARALSTEGLAEAARAMMTTDTRPKFASGDLSATAEGEHGARAARIVGIAKGAGMIHPNMATMLAVILTDALVSQDVLAATLKRAVQRSFNRISVDGDTSTNDTVLVLANGASALAPTPTEFEIMLTSVCMDLAQQIARDGEGATKFVTLKISGARDEAMAEAVGRAIARSLLVKTALYGEDPNWGRVLAAAGASGQDIDPDRLTLRIGDVQVYANGAPMPYNEAEAAACLKNRDITLHLDLGLGDASATIWTCDLSHDYVTINGRYRT